MFLCMLDDLVASVGTCVERQLERSILDYLNTKYVTLIENLKKVYKKKKRHYSVSYIITGLCTADKGNLTFFASEECLRLAKTLDDVFFHIGRAYKYFDFTILKTFIDASGCTKAKELMENYIKEIEHTVITGLNLEEEYECKGSTKKFEIVCDNYELKVGESDLIKETLQRCLKLPSASISLRGVIRNCIIIVCRVPLEVEYYLFQLKITARELKPLSTLKITSLIVDGKMKLNIPMDCDAEVCTYIRTYIITYTLYHAFDINLLYSTLFAIILHTFRHKEILLNTSTFHAFNAFYS